MKSFYLLLSGLAFLFLLSCNKSKDNYDATGSFEATEIIVSSQANGKIVEFTVNEGEQLQQGQQVGLIDSTQLHLQKMSLLSNQRGVRAQQPDIRTQTAAIQEQIRTLEREKARVQRLLASNAANRKQLDDIESQIDVLQRQLSAQTSTLQKNTQNISAQGSTLDI